VRFAARPVPLRPHGVMRDGRFQPQTGASTPTLDTGELMLLAVSSLWIGLAVALYVVLFITLGVMTIRKGHWVMFIIGIFFPIFWIIGALMPPARR
jgi:hypothetical protein